ncbi:O-antigen ligase family protein [Terrimonas pollutisoli]|uniref:O-antigen ligase family protein n=1 Tax=Terrimonas pollutisoli TaxID=3034147 RepID=UPI0023EC8D34|nr:O-antigen ligase family protein [Terrimonas sp. H1YJ31]
MPLIAKKNRIERLTNGEVSWRTYAGDTRNKILGLLNYTLYFSFFASLIFSLRAVSSLSIAAILLTGAITNKQALSSLFKKNYFTFFLAGCTVLFLLQVFGLLYTENIQQALNSLRVKAGLLLIPLAVLLSLNFSPHVYQKLVKHYCLLLTIASLYCFVRALLKHHYTNDSSVFFYHSLVSPIGQHAVYFSVLVMIGISFLTDSFYKKKVIIAGLINICLIVFLSAVLFMLSSKLVILFYSLCLLYFFISFAKKSGVKRITISGFFLISLGLSSLILISKNPVSERFRDITNGSLHMITQPHFSKADYFNGLQFRLLQWRFVPEILSENKSWWLGVGSGDAQDLLNRKYVSKNMYTGEKERNDIGYMAYNTHNQFLETLLQNGIIGLTALLLTCFFAGKMAFESRKKTLILIVLLFFAWLFTESVLERQYGIMIFIFFPLFILQKENTTVATKLNPGAEKITLLQ